MNEADEEFDRARQKSQGRFRSAFEAIFEKYGKLDDKDDIIDLVTGEIIVDNGRMRKAPVIELGDLLHYPDSPSDSLRARSRKRKRRFRSPEFTGRGAGSSGSLSPELISYEEQLKQALSRQAADQATDTKPLAVEADAIQDFSDTDGSDAESLNLDFAPYSSLFSREHIATKDSIRKRANRRRDSLESNDRSYSYESSDSVGTEQETSIDTYFTSSIEQYLEKLRHQLAAPPVEYAEDNIDDATDDIDRKELDYTSEAEDEQVKDSSGDESENACSEGSNEWSDQSSNLVFYRTYKSRSRHRSRFRSISKSLLNPYAIPSSPRTITPFSPSDRTGSFENMPPERRVFIEEIYASDTCSQESELFSEEESVSSVCSSESVVIVEPWQQHDMPMFVGQVEQKAHMTYAQDYSDGDFSEEEPVQDPFISGHRFGQEAFSDFSPNFINSMNQQSRHPNDYHPASLPPQSLTGTINNCSQISATSHWSHPSSHSHAAVSMVSGTASSSLAIHARREKTNHYNASVSASGPILLKPQPVSPHVFFDFEEPSSHVRASSAFKSTLYRKQPSDNRRLDLDQTDDYDHNHY